MSPSVVRIIEDLHEMENDLEREAHERQRRWHSRIRRVRFDKRLPATHRRPTQTETRVDIAVS